MLFYRSSLPLSRQTLQYVTGVVGRHRKQIRSKGRALSAGMQALMTLAYLKNGETFAQLGVGFGVGTTTAWRYVNETVTLLPARSPKLSRALAKARKDGLLYLVLGGTLIPIDRVKADRPFYFGKHKKRGMNLRHRRPGRNHRAGVGAVARLCPRSQGRPDPGSGPRTGRLRNPGAGRQGLPARASRRPTRARTNPSPARTPTAPTPGSADRANAPTPSSRTGRS